MHVSCLKASSYQGIIVQRRCCATWSFPTQHFLKSRTIFFRPSSSQNTQVLPSPDMPTTTLLDLPPELIIIVFKSFSEFASAAALVQPRTSSTQFGRTALPRLRMQYCLAPSNALIKQLKGWRPTTSLPTTKHRPMQPILPFNVRNG